MESKTTSNFVKKSFFSNYKWAFIPVLLGLLLYSNTFHHGFVLDDNLVTQDKFVVNGFKNITDLFTEKTLPEVGNIKPYRPITAVSFALDYALFKTDNLDAMASRLHIMNVFYFCITLLLSFIFVKKLFKSATIAIAVSSLFASHPLHVEVVANIKSRDEILAFLFGFLSLIFYQKYCELKSKKWFYLTLVFYFIAILSKESAILFLLVFPIVRFYLDDKKYIVKDLQFLIVPALLYLLLQRMVLGITLMPKMTEIDNMLVGITNTSDNLATRFYLVGLYLYKFLVPNMLMYDYSINYISKKTFASPEVWASIVSLLLLIYFTYKGIIKKNKIAFGTLFMIVMFLLTCNLFISIGATFAERFTFTPSFGFVIAISIIAFELIKKINQKSIYTLLLLFPVLLLYSFKTYSRNKDWKSNAVLFTHDYKNCSKSLRIQNNYASVFYQQTKKTVDLVEKKKLMLKSVEILDTVTKNYPNYIEAYLQKGICYLEIKDCENAIKNFEQAKKIGKYNFVIQSNLGIGYINCGRSNEAIGIFSNLLKEDKTQEKFYLKNLAVAYYNVKNIDSSNYYFTTLKQKYPDDLEVDNYLNLVNNYKKASLNTTKNQSQTQIGNSINTTLFDAAYKKYQSGDKNSAEKMLLDFIKINQTHAMSYAILGLIADEKKQFSKAIQYYKKSIALNPADYRIQFNLGNTFLKNNDETNAVIQFEKTIAMQPSYLNSYKSLELYYKSKNNLEKTTYYSNKIKEIENK